MTPSHRMSINQLDPHSFFELVKRLLSNGQSRKVNGLSVHKYIDKARQLFTEMNLAYDLKELERFINK
jgi:hypothetical protein